MPMGIESDKWTSSLPRIVGHPEYFPEQTCPPELTLLPHSVPIKQ